MFKCSGNSSIHMTAFPVKAAAVVGVQTIFSGKFHRGVAWPGGHGAAWPGPPRRCPLSCAPLALGVRSGVVAVFYTCGTVYVEGVQRHVLSELYLEP